jgi:NAD+ kinase
MDKIAIYSRVSAAEDVVVIKNLMGILTKYGISYLYDEHIANILRNDYDYSPEKVFYSPEDLIEQNCTCIISLGGDGTLLDTLAIVKTAQIPVLGINLGRLGFLSSVPEKRLEDAVLAIRTRQYKIESRSVLQLSSSAGAFNSFPYALNDFTVHKRDTGSMITIDTYLNGEFFNSYWADGIILATPTGSTAYSLSCGGPVIFPDSKSLVLTPSAPHNLNIRPIIINDESVVTFKVKGRGLNHLISLDSRYEVVDYQEAIAVHKAPFAFKLMRLNFENFIHGLREKLNWGLDTRNF